MQKLKQDDDEVFQTVINGLHQIKEDLVAKGRKDEAMQFQSVIEKLCLGFETQERN